MDTKELIETAVQRFLEEVPALKQLKLIFQLQLRARGDTQSWYVELPAVKATKGVADHALVEVEVFRAQFNQLAEKGTVAGWTSAVEKGELKATGTEAILKLIANVVSRHEARTKRKKVRS